MMAARTLRQATVPTQPTKPFPFSNTIHPVFSPHHDIARTHKPVYRHHASIGARVPELKELLDHICTASLPRVGFAYPPEAPVCWVKYGWSVLWNEVCAQVMAYNGLRQLSSSVHAPGVFYAFENYPMTYIVMEYIPGKTAGQCLKESHEQAAKETIYQSIGLAITELCRIPITITTGSRPAAVSGAKIRHSIFAEQEAPVHYENVQQLEDHINAFLQLTKKQTRVSGLSLEPMVFCQSDLFPENFIINNSRVTAIDFSDASIVPSSFAKYTLVDHRLGFDIRQWVNMPTTSGADNTGALQDLSGRIVMGSYSFAKLGRRLPGGDEETQARFDQALRRQESESTTELTATDSQASGPEG